MQESSVSPGVSIETMAESLRRIEQRLETLERWRSTVEPASEGIAPESAGDPAIAASSVPYEAPAPSVIAPLPDLAVDSEIGFDLSLVGRTLIILGGAFLLRALTEGGVVPAAVGVAIGLLYAAGWSIHSLRTAVSRGSAAWNGVATALIALPLIFEATKKFHLFGPWSSALALLGVTAVMFVLIWRRQLEGLAWTFSLMALVLTPLLMLQTKSAVPFALYLTALGVAALWLGYRFEWTLIRWVVAFELDIVLFVLSFLAATNQLDGVSPAVVIVVDCVAFAAYLSSFAVRTLIRQREAVPFEIAQTLALLAAGFGGAIWVAASRSTLEVPLAAVMIALGAASYAVSFAFIPRRFATPRNFVFYSSLALMLIVVGGAFTSHGQWGSILFAALALTCGILAVRFRKSSLVLHAAVYLFSGFVGAGLVQLAFRSLVLKVENGWPLPEAGTMVLLIACLVAAGIRPIERQGSFELWTAGKVMILAELGWIGATLLMSTLGLMFLDDAGTDPAFVATARTAVLAGLTVLTAWASRFTTFSPGRFLCNPLMMALGVKLVWEDFRVGRPGTLFVSLAIVGVALILTPRLRRAASPPQPATASAAAAVAPAN